MSLFQTSISTSTNSAAANLNWRSGRPVTATVTSASSTTTGSFVVQYSLDDLQSSSSPTWASVSSVAGSSVATVYLSSTIFDPGLTLTFLNPIAALRITSSANTATLTLKVLQ